MDCTPTSLVAAARCFADLSQDDLSAIPLYLACQWAVGAEAASGWAARVVTNGGAAPSTKSKLALGIFYARLNTSDLLSKMIAVNCFAPDDIKAAITPLIVGPGLDPWLNPAPSFSGVDLSVNGLVGNGATHYLSTGVVPSTAFANDTSCGLTLYVYSGANEAAQDFGGGLNSGSQINLVVSGFPNASFWDSYDITNGRITAVNSAWTGFLSGNRVAATGAGATALYKASSGTAFTTVVTGALAGGTRPAHAIYCFALNTNGVPGFWSSKRISFAAIQLGLTEAECRVFYTLVQSMRVSLGGGYV